MTEPSSTLAAALAKCGVTLPVEQIEQMDDYCQLVWRWNEKLNLTRHTTYDLFASRDVVDSMHLADLLLPGEEILDVGTGGGVPGVLLSILRPDCDIALCESVAKKANAVRQIVETLDLPVAMHHARAEPVLEDLRFDAVVARAVGPLWKMCKWFEPHWAMIGRLLAVKGPRWVDERGEARHRGYLANLNLRCVATWPMPDTDSESVVLKVWPKSRPEPGVAP